MKVLFVNTNDVGGGAAIAAMRLHEGLEKFCNTENYFIVGNKRSNLNNVFPSRSWVQKKLESAVDLLTSMVGLQYQYSLFSGANIIKKARELQPDVISLHNSHGGYFATKDLETLSTIAPVVWTLHDMWSFTGNSAHTFGDESWKVLKNSSHLKRIPPRIGLNTGSFLLKQKEKIYRHSNLSVVTPSRWLQHLAQQSPVFDKIPVRQINNGIDLQVFQKLNQAEIRNKLGIAPEAKVLMFMAESIKKDNPWKGGTQLIDIIAGINGRINQRVELLIIGNGEFQGERFANFHIHNLGYVADSATMVEYFNAADVFIYPTKADNLPNVLVEAIACGTPCVSNDIGGCNEVILNDYNGYIIRKGLSEFIEKTIGLLNSERLDMFSVNCLAHAQNFDQEAISQQYYSLFRELIPDSSLG